MDEEDVDIESDFDFKPLGLEVEVGCDDADLPSNSVQLQPEFSQHPWSLEQGFSLDHCADEKSRAAIEKMLLEEQLYSDGRSFRNQDSLSSVTRLMTESVNTDPIVKVDSKVATKKNHRSWSEQEKQVFTTGLEIFGHRWTKIAEMLPNKSVQQVKHYGGQHFKQQASSIDDQVMDTQICDMSCSLDNTVTIITTAQTTVKTLPLSLSQKKKSGVVNNKEKKHSKSAESKKKSSIPSKNCTHNVVGKSVPSTEIIYLKKEAECSEEEDVEVDIDSDEDRSVPYQSSIPNIHSSVAYPFTITTTALASNSKHSVVPNIKYKSILKENLLNGLDDRETTSDGLDLVRGESDLVDVETSVYLDNVCLSTSTNDVILDETVNMLENDSVLNQHDRPCQLSPHNTEASEQEKSPEASGHSPTESKNFVLDSIHGDLDHNSDIFEELVTTVVQTENQLPPSPSMTAEISECPKTLTPLQNYEGCDEFFDDEDDEDERKEDQQDDNRSDSSTDDQDREEFGVLTSSGQVVYLPNPTCEASVDRPLITDEERTIHKEFFDGRPGLKTPDRYQRIRNYILDAWLKCQPTYLNKTSVRLGLKNCGDVNCIGRIHSYLEQIGAINFGCEQVQYLHPERIPQPKPPRERPNRENRLAAAQARAEKLCTRKRRVRDMDGGWIDERDLEGRTIEHKPTLKKKVARVTNRNDFDPFTLIPCKRFNDSDHAPFDVCVEGTALVLIDVHAHLSKTEVIGLLGGQYDVEGGELNVCCAEPCDSLSTGMQCEMDPVSQTAACERLHAAGLQVVGWYHSHPMFEPNPSNRDIETQHKFQSWFAQEGSPFIGVIVSPYSRDNPSPHSLVNCLTVVCNSNSLVTSANVQQNPGVPYKFEYALTHTSPCHEQLFAATRDLAHKYVNLPNSVRLQHNFRSIAGTTCLDKMLKSCSRHLPSDSAALNVVEGDLRQIFVEVYSDPAENTNTEYG